MDVEVLTGPQGCGKSFLMRAEALATPGLYLFALPTIELIRAQAEAFRADAPQLDTIEVHSESSGRGDVSKRLEEARDLLVKSGAAHAVILTTHEAMMDNDLSAFTGWHARIDEAPNAVTTGTLNIAVTRKLFEKNYRLVSASGVGWSYIEPLVAGSSWKDVAGDTLAKNAPEFLKLIDRPQGVFVNITEWAKASKVQWFSLWSPLTLDNFASVQIAGANYVNSLGFLASEELFKGKIDFKIRPVPMVRTASPDIRIHYFTRAHEGTTTFWEKTEGRGVIKRIADYLEHKVPTLGFWSGNAIIEKLLDHRAHGMFIRPKPAGLNLYRDLTSCAFIYSSKAVPEDAALRSAFDITDEQIRRSREDEDIAQFVMRGAIRKRDFGDVYDIYLYSEGQAQKLGTYLTDSGIPKSVELVTVDDAGVRDVARVVKPPKPRADNADAKAKRKTQDRKRAQKARARKAVAAGRKVGKAGRPRKST